MTKASKLSSPNQLRLKLVNTLAMKQIRLVSIWLFGIQKICHAKKPTCGYWHSCFFHQTKGSSKSFSRITIRQNKNSSDFNKVSLASSLNVRAPNKNSSSTCVYGGGVFARLGLMHLNTMANMGIKIFESYSFIITWALSLPIKFVTHFKVLNLGSNMSANILWAMDASNLSQKSRNGCKTQIATWAIRTHKILSTTSNSPHIKGGTIVARKLYSF